MRSKCINFTSGRKYLTGNEFTAINFFYDVDILAARRRFSCILVIFQCMCVLCSLDHITTSGLKSDVII